MAHYRQTIRNAVIAKLTGETAAEANVFGNRSRPILEIMRRNESVISVYTEDETSSRNGDSYQLERKLSVSIEIAVGGGDGVDEALDDLAGEVETLIDADPTLGNLLSEEMVLASTNSGILSEGNQCVGVCRLDYDCVYRTERQPAGVDDPIPTEININAKLSAADINEPLAGPVEDTESACDEETGCDIPAWKGDQ